MIGFVLRSLPRDPAYRRHVLLVFALLLAMNAGAWLWALAAFAGQPVLLGVGVVVYGLGLRHAVDADHIAAIDNITRKFLQHGDRSATIGLWFAIGHSAVIFLATALVVIAAGHLSHLQQFRQIGGFISTGVSSLFLLLVAGMNLCIFIALVRTLRRARAGHAIRDDELDLFFAGNGLMSRLFRPLFGVISKPWHMGLLGFLFGLSFDTATEISLFSISATQAAQGTSFAAALVYPALFAAGMSLLDTADGVMMTSAYQWAVADPLRKLYYNMTITMMSIAVALFIGLVELNILAVRLLGLTGPFASFADDLSANLNYLGIAIVAVFLLAWIASIITFRLVGSGASATPAGAGA